jgi:hypothetical protein
MWYYKKYVAVGVDGGTKVATSWKPDMTTNDECIGMFPMNSACIFKKSTVDYRNLHQEDDYLFR